MGHVPIFHGYVSHNQRVGHFRDVTVMKFMVSNHASSLRISEANAWIYQKILQEIPCKSLQSEAPVRQRSVGL